MTTELALPETNFSEFVQIHQGEKRKSTRLTDAGREYIASQLTERGILREEGGINRDRLGEYISELKSRYVKTPSEKRTDEQKFAYLEVKSLEMQLKREEQINLVEAIEVSNSPYGNVYRKMIGGLRELPEYSKKSVEYVENMVQPVLHKIVETVQRIEGAKDSLATDEITSIVLEKLSSNWTEVVKVAKEQAVTTDAPNPRRINTLVALCLGLPATKLDGSIGQSVKHAAVDALKTKNARDTLSVMTPEQMSVMTLSELNALRAASRYEMLLPVEDHVERVIAEAGTNGLTELEALTEILVDPAGDYMWLPKEYKAQLVERQEELQISVGQSKFGVKTLGKVLDQLERLRGWMKPRKVEPTDIPAVPVPKWSERLARTMGDARAKAKIAYQVMCGVRLATTLTAVGATTAAAIGELEHLSQQQSVSDVGFDSFHPQVDTHVLQVESPVFAAAASFFPSTQDIERAIGQAMHSPDLDFFSNSAVIQDEPVVEDIGTLQTISDVKTETVEPVRTTVVAAFENKVEDLISDGCLVKTDIKDLDGNTIAVGIDYAAEDDLSHKCESILKNEDTPRIDEIYEGRVRTHIIEVDGKSFPMVGSLGGTCFAHSLNIAMGVATLRSGETPVTLNPAVIAELLHV